MQKPVFIKASYPLSSLGKGNDIHWDAVINGRKGMIEFIDHTISDSPLCAAPISPIDWAIVGSQIKKLDRLPLELMCLYTIIGALQELETSIDLKQTIFILSSTKGNIEFLDKLPDARNDLFHSARIIAEAVGISQKPIIISQACASGVVALQYGKLLLNAKRCKHVIITGADRLSKFVFSGFNAFQALSATPCKPFDKNRNGLNLGEAAATVILSSEQKEGDVSIISGATSNDANHISAPSRTGEELAIAIKRTLSVAGLQPEEVGMVSAHGTGTAYNDEMESKAFHLCGLSHIPLHSFKSYTGHTLGAAGILEVIIASQALKKQMLIPSLGYKANGVSHMLNVTEQFNGAKFNYILKTASGFGGTNAALLLKR